jgi:hypothetical protein
VTTSIELTAKHLTDLRTEGHLRVPNAVSKPLLDELLSAADALLAKFPFGFDHPGFYSGQRPVPRTAAPVPKDVIPTLLIQNVGFLKPAFLKPLCEPVVHNFIESIVGKDFYLSNTWLQLVPPGTPRLNFHKDPRGSLTLCLLLDDSGVGMGNTCLVPSTHVNTPPVQYCIDNIMQQHPREIELTGKAGDFIFFTAETWHARAANQTDSAPRRLFFNFYSRSSKDTTAWNGVVNEEELKNAKSVVPNEYHHFFEIDPDRTKQLSSFKAPRLKRWALAKSSSDDLLRDFVYASSVYGANVEHPDRKGFLLPYTTALATGERFKVLKYLSFMRLKPIVRETVVKPLRNLRRLWGAGRKQPNAQAQ